MDPLAILGVIFGAITILGLLATAYVRWRSSSVETTATLWKEEAEAWKAKANRLEEMYSSLEKRVDHLEAENRMLRELHDSKREIGELRLAMTEGFAEIKIAITKRSEQ